ncbi:MAG: hypothetical protein ACI8RZ_002862 [Myxococcota bacterium]|jgi:hypothetical protein
MRLDDLQAELRQRNPWEAIDLGFAMARRWWRPLVAAWCAVVLPVGVLIALGLHSRPWLAVILLWWLKPLWGRVPRFVLSRALFGAQPSVREVLGAKLWRRNLGELFWRRPDPLRTFLSPISDLENLSGSERRRRRAVLGHRGSGAALALSLIGLMMEISVMLGLAGLVLMMLPDDPQYAIEVVIDRIAIGESPAWLSAAMPGVYLVAVSLVEPLVVAGGFGLYINRRTRLEGWDVELAFRRLARRLQGAVAVGLLLLALAPTASAQEPDPEAALEVVLEQREFQPIIVEEQWKFRYEIPELSPEAQKLVPFLGEMIRVIAYAFLAVGLVVMVGLVLRYVRLPTRRKVEKPLPLSSRTGVLLPDDDSPLPTDLTTKAWALWSAGRHPEALSLLYRGALVDLITAGLRIEEGSTEGECLRQVRAAGLEPDKVTFFAELTRCWMALAYARRAPTTSQAEALCAAWDVHFEVAP